MNEVKQEQFKSMSELMEHLDEVFGVSVTPPQSIPADVKPPLNNGNKSNGQGTPVMDEKTWERVNARRGDLIRQKYTASLTCAEQAELDALEEVATRYLNVVAPLSDYPLDVLQVHIDRIKADQKNDS